MILDTRRLSAACLGLESEDQTKETTEVKWGLTLS